MITIEALGYTYPGAAEPALRDVSLRVRPGEFVVLAGTSGAGKSTLLRCLNGLTPHFSGGIVSGRVEVAGLDVLQAGPRLLSRHVGFVFQDPEGQAVLDRVEPELAFSLEQQAMPPAEMRLRVEEVLNLLELTHLRNRPLVTLSGGERQRVAIATALALRPPILALDEPTSQLDPQSAEEVLQALVRLNEEVGLTIILAEHRLERVLRHADRLVYLEGGRVVVDDEPRTAVAHIPQRPPLIELALALNWQPIPLTVKEARRFAQASPKSEIPINNLHLAVDNASSSPDPLIPAPSSSKNTLLEGRELRYSYGKRPVLRGVNLQVRPGEAVVLLGRNGAGKSTLLRCLVGLLRPQSGEVLLAGRSTRQMDVADICQQVAYLPQNPDDLLFAETVAEELAITLRNHKLVETAVPLPPAALLAQLGLANKAEAYPRDLSVGQRQRVALGAVLVTGPRLLLLDEPTRGLDYEAKRELVKLWQAWLAAGMGLLLVTHDVELAAQVANRVLVMSEGEIIAEGPAAEVLSSSPLFAPQMARLFPGRGWLTAADALNNFGF
jgi:energy-coupling factor transporter ATP-binding protein EcfA2